MKNRIFFMGDIHGQAAWITDFAKRLTKKGMDPLDASDWIVLLGDSGLNYWVEPHQARRMITLKEELAEMPCHFFVVRGNHEERAENMAKAAPQNWTLQVMPANNAIQGVAWKEYNYSNIYYAADCPSMYNFKGYNVFVIPGAYSADKLYRLSKGYNSFESEQLSETEQIIGKQIAYANRHVDFILSHTCPIEYEPTDLFLPMIDQKTVDKSMELYLSDINKIIGSNFWLFGHYHAFRVYPMRQGEGQKIMLYHEALEMDNILKGNYWEFI